MASDPYEIPFELDQSKKKNGFFYANLALQEYEWR